MIADFAETYEVVLKNNLTTEEWVYICKAHSSKEAIELFKEYWKSEQNVQEGMKYIESKQGTDWKITSKEKVYLINRSGDVICFKEQVKKMNLHNCRESYEQLGWYQVVNSFDNNNNKEDWNLVD